MRILTLGKKVKLKLTQPAIMCSGRKNVECYYRGVVTGLNETHARIQFKRYGEDVEHFYDLDKDEFVDDELKDIQIL